MRVSEATSVTGGPKRWQGELAEGWDILGITNGGYGMALATRAMGAGAGERRLISATGTFVNRSTPGPVAIDVETLKEGKMTTALRSTVSREGTSLFFVTGVFGSANGTVTRDMVAGDPPDLPDPESCVRMVPTEGVPFPPPFFNKVDARIHPEDAAAFLGAHSPVPSTRGWFRLLDGEPLDPHGVAMAADAFPPAIFTSEVGPGWTPTVELSVQVRNPAPVGWLSCRFTTRFVTGGMLEEDGELWDETGRLVALSRQLALVPR